MHERGDIQAMSGLAKIFQPIVTERNARLDEITVVAFDTNGTLVHTNTNILSGRQFVADIETSQLLRDLQRNKEELGIDEIVIISVQKDVAEKNLYDAGLGRLLKNPVEEKSSFYDRMFRENKKILVIDDDPSFDAEAYIDPKADEVKAYLKARPYRHELKAA